MIATPGPATDRELFQALLGRTQAAPGDYLANKEMALFCSARK